MSRSGALRTVLANGGLAASGHDGLTARLVEDAGFDVVWASGLEISASYGVPDANILTMTEVLHRAANMAASVSTPVLADCDSGFGDVGNVVAMTRAFEAAGVAGVCIEDQTFPKVNSLADGPHDLVPVEHMMAKVYAAKQAQRSTDFVVVARTEALIAGGSVEEALHRARAYEQAGADALLIHSRRPTAAEIAAFCWRYCGRAPLIAVPTTYPATSAAELHAMGISLVIYANQTLRRAVRAIRETLASIRADGSAHGVDDQLCSIQDLFDLQGMGTLLREWQHYQQKAREVGPAAHAADGPA
jgi:phosphoenolpyruvate phosphomutase